MGRPLVEEVIGLLVGSLSLLVEGGVGVEHLGEVPGLGSTLEETWASLQLHHAHLLLRGVLGSLNPVADLLVALTVSEVLEVPGGSSLFEPLLVELLKVVLVGEDFGGGVTEVGELPGVVEALEVVPQVVHLGDEVVVLGLVVVLYG